MHAIVQFASAATFWIVSTYRKSSKSIHYPANGQQPIIVPQVFNITAHEYTLLRWNGEYEPNLYENSQDTQTLNGLKFVVW